MRFYITFAFKLHSGNLCAAFGSHVADQQLSVSQRSMLIKSSKNDEDHLEATRPLKIIVSHSRLSKFYFLAVSASESEMHVI